MNHKEADQLAQRLSIENPDDYFYINWIEDNEYCVEKVPEFSYQNFYHSGVFLYGDIE